MVDEPRKSRLQARRELRRIASEWRGTNTLEPLDPEAKVTFFVPLVSRMRATDWEQVERNLAATIRSLVRQTDPRWEVWICGQDRPEAADADPRIRFLPFPTPIETGMMSDKGPKMRLLRERLFASPPSDGYLFALDADDILHPALVGHFLGHGARGGYILNRGYMVDHETRQMAKLEPAGLLHPWRHPFSRHCGSCSAVRIDRRAGGGFEALLKHRGKHTLQVARLAQFGVRLLDVPFPAALYMVNHGENLRQRRRKLEPKLRYLRRNLISPDEAAAVAREFRLPDVAETAGSAPAPPGTR